MTKAQIQTEALGRAVNPIGGTMNYGLIITGFVEKGIPEADIRPRENVFTFNAWQALGRGVKAGERGVKVCVFVRGSKKTRKEDGTEQTETWSAPRSTTVFHISQTVEKG